MDNANVGVPDILSEIFSPDKLLFRGMGVKADPWQVKFLREAPERALLLCARQVGKSTVAAVCAAHTAVYSDASLILLVSPSIRQSQEIFRKTKGILHEAFPADMIVDESLLRIELKNGSRILSLPGKSTTLRGFSAVDLIVIDEAAIVLDELYYSIRPMVAISKGRILALSTPLGKRGWFFNAWQSKANWYRAKVNAYDCARISKEFLSEERQALGDAWFRQEYMCDFVESEDQVFSFDLVHTATDEALQGLWATG